MSDLGWLTLWSVLFAGTHLAMSHPLRAPMVKAFGEMGFQIVYSFISLATLILAVRAYGEVQPGAPWLWAPGMIMWGIASFLMLLASIWFVGSVIRNPALPHPDAGTYARAPVKGVFATTRHPMMWAFAVWGITHIMVNPTWPSIVLSLSIIVTALVGAWGQDHKKSLLMGEDWRAWKDRTSFFPFAKGLHPMGLPALIGGTLLFFVATYAHGWLGAAPSGLWIWFNAAT